MRRFGRGFECRGGLYPMVQHELAVQFSGLQPGAAGIIEQCPRYKATYISI